MIVSHCIYFVSSVDRATRLETSKNQTKWNNHETMRVSLSEIGGFADESHAVLGDRDEFIVFVDMNK